MKFCPKCGGIMIPAMVKGKKVLKCRVCGYVAELTDEKSRNIYRVQSKIKKSPHDKIIVIEKDQKVEVLPKTKVICPKCGNTEAYYWEVQTRSADEPATRFFKCTKCGNVWREYQ
ncbi:MAG: transcription factor S [Thermoprotei archaeon]|nr:MAG: transcription factor S [Thermoprotei archaeon]